jgi:hypothetical protein
MRWGKRLRRREAPCPPAQGRLTPADRALLLFFHRHSHGTDGGKPHLVAFHLRDERLFDEVMVALVATFATILLGQLDTVTFDLVDGTDVNAVGADNFHAL